mgnify:FL=1
MAILDEADYRILDILQKDGRITFSDLADQVNLSRSAVRERIKNMQDSGFTAIIDAKAYEKFASVYMDIEAEPMKINDVAKELMKLNEIAIVSQHTGSTGLHVHAYIDSVDKVSKYLEENIYTIDGVRGVHFELLVHQYKTTAYLARYSE